MGKCGPEKTLHLDTFHTVYCQVSAAKSFTIQTIPELKAVIRPTILFESRQIVIQSLYIREIFTKPCKNSLTVTGLENARLFKEDF